MGGIWEEMGIDTTIRETQPEFHESGESAAFGSASDAPAEGSQR